MNANIILRIGYKGGKKEEALLQDLFTRATEEYYETMKTSLVQITLKTPKVRGLENEDNSLRRFEKPMKGRYPKCINNS